MNAPLIFGQSASPEIDSATKQHSAESASGTQFMTLRDVADILDVSLSTLRRRIAEGALRVHRIGRAIRISQTDLAAFLAASRGAES